MPSLSGMKPDGFYDRHSSGQRSSIEILLPWLDEAADIVPLPVANQPITIADFGCSEGRNALMVLNRAVSALRRRGATQAIVPIYSDLATNNFNQVFRNLATAGQLAADQAGIFPMAAGGSFFGPLLAPGSVHLATTFNAVCWLDAVPAAIPDYIICPPPEPHRTDIHVPTETISAFATQARQDLTRFLTCRAAEMASGARLLVAVPGRTATDWTGGGLYDLLHDACMDLVRQGRLDRAAYERTVQPVYFRSMDELLEPIATSGSDLSQVLAVEKSQCDHVPTAFVVDYERSGDLDRYVDEFVGFVQAFSEPIIRPIFEPASGPHVVDEVYARAKERLRGSPESYPFRYVQIATLLVKR